MVDSQVKLELGPRTFLLGGEVDAAAATAGERPRPPPHPIQAFDDWARYVWRYHRASPSVFIAIPLWAAVRFVNRLTLTVAVLAYYAARPFVWLYWRLYELFGPAARLTKKTYWAFIFPALACVARGVSWIYWRLYELCGPAARVAQRLYWLSVFPVLELVGRGLRWAYWRLVFPWLEGAARLVGFSINPNRQRLTANTASASPERIAEVVTFASNLSADDAIILPANSMVDFDALFDCLPRFGLTKPAAARLYVWLGPQLLDVGNEQLRLLGLRLRAGSPFKSVWFYTSDRQAAQKLQAAIEAPVYTCSGRDRAGFAELVAARSLTEGASFEVKQFGPIVLLTSALWGRVGSTMIFDAQAKFLIESGAIVVRVFVDHNPGHGEHGVKRRQALLNENLSNVYPHFFVVAERDTAPKRQYKLRRQFDYRSRSGIRRLELELEGALPLNSEVLNWAGAAASLSVVNHASHMAFAQRVSSAPIILETHDVLTQQLESHGWPNFVSLEYEPLHLREQDQAAIWNRAHFCVNLSPEDHTAISACNPSSAFVRPYASSVAPVRRPWSDVVAANNLSPDFAASEDIEVLLWGDWHAGNARAVRWVFDLVRPKHPLLAESRLAIVGRVSQIIPGRLRRLPNVVSCGFVDNLEDFFARAKVLVIADQEGSGVSIKAIEAVRYGLPFVSTTAGMRGLDLAGIDYTPADTAAAFAADLAALLRDPDARAKRAAMAREIYAKNISHDVYRGQWRRIVRAAAPDFGAEGAEAKLAAAPRASGLGPALALAAWSGHGVKQSAAPRLAPRAQAKHALAAVICTYNRYDVLPGAVESLLRQDLAPSDLEIVVVDNSPDQAQAARFGQSYAGTSVRYLLEPIPGLSNARNVGAEMCSAQYVAYIDDDALAARDWARNLLAALRQFAPKAAVAGGRIIPRWITPRPDWLPDELIGNLSIVDWGGRARVLGAREWIAGCNIAFDRDALLDLGGFSRALGRVGAGAPLLSNEESEVIDKFSEAGRSAIYVPEATVEHLIEPARLSQEWFRRRAAWQAVSDYIKSPRETASYAAAAAERLRQELRSDNPLPPGFSQRDSERESFRRDVGLMYDVVIAMLAGGVEIDADGKSSTLPQDKLVASVRRAVQKRPNLRATIRKLTNM